MEGFKPHDARLIAIRWEPQEEGMMSTAASFPLVKNQGVTSQDFQKFKKPSCIHGIIAFWVSY